MAVAITLLRLERYGTLLTSYCRAKAWSQSRDRFMHHVTVQLRHRLSAANEVAGQNTDALNASVCKRADVICVTLVHDNLPRHREYPRHRFHEDRGPLDTGARLIRRCNLHSIGREQIRRNPSFPTGRSSSPEPEDLEASADLSVAT